MKLDSNQVVFVLRVEHVEQIEQAESRKSSQVRLLSEAVSDAAGNVAGNVVSDIGLSDSVALIKNESSLVQLQQDGLLFHLHDLRRGMQFTFVSWQEIRDYIKEHSKKGLR